MWTPRFTSIMTGTPIGVEVGLAAGSGKTCIARIFACAGVELGSLAGTGVGLDHQREIPLHWLAATAGLRWRHRLTGALGLVADADAVVPLVRPQFMLDDGSVAFQPSPLAARISVAIEIAPGK